MICIQRLNLPNDPRFSRREASGASEAVGWKRMLGGVTLPIISDSVSVYQAYNSYPFPVFTVSDITA